MSKAVFKSLALASTLSLTTLLSFPSHATIVEVETSHGNFKINLHDQTTPKTVANFLKYVIAKDYDDTVVHRLVSDIVIQAGGFSFDGDFPLTPISTDSPVVNEPVYSNVKGTIAMAKPQNSPDGATSQWFINYKDNSTSGYKLDTNTGGFTVFGEVIEGMDKINAIASLNICNLVAGWQNRQDVPMPGYTSAQCADSSFVPGVENFVTIYRVAIIDPTVVTDGNLSSVKNTSLSPTDSSGSSGGGSLSYFALLTLALCGLRQKIKSA